MKSKLTLSLLLCAASAALLLTGCDRSGTPVSASGVSKASVSVHVGEDGLTAEQRAVHDRVLMDNKPGSVKHLYIIAPESGQVILYSTVKVKVTSSGKRLTPNSVSAQNSGIAIDIGNERHYTTEVLSDDGTYGSSVDYIFWWDVRGAYHQHFFTGGQIIHVSDQPIQVKNVILNLELNQAPVK